jgi:hypothetical protein
MATVRFKHKGTTPSGANVFSAEFRRVDDGLARPALDSAEMLVPRPGQRGQKIRGVDRDAPRRA